MIQPYLVRRSEDFATKLPPCKCKCTKPKYNDNLKQLPSSLPTLLVGTVGQKLVWNLEPPQMKPAMCSLYCQHHLV